MILYIYKYIYIYAKYVIYIYIHTQILYQESQNLIVKVNKFHHTLNSGPNSYTLKQHLY